MKEFIEKLIERLEELKSEAYDKCDGGASHRAYSNAISIVNQLAEEYINCSTDTSTNTSSGWIPCSEKLPDDFMSFEYLTIRKGHTLATITYYCVANHKWYSNRNSTREIEVIAWQPLPPAYVPKEGRE